MVVEGMVKFSSWEVGWVAPRSAKPAPESSACRRFSRRLRTYVWRMIRA
jgi:hypothetical protein